MDTGELLWKRNKMLGVGAETCDRLASPYSEGAVNTFSLFILRKPG